MILSGQSLVDTLRNKCDKAQKRIWIVSPFIGEFNDVQKIIGNQWSAPHIDFRILTDVKYGFLKKKYIHRIFTKQNFHTFTAKYSC